ncbi:hypothetical protein [Bacillus sp. NPDC094106]|uniref:hypothetical protein n=1 Tax=Bacillus sp. NPDC094106 TaxID=3363949 RepID=UPI003803C2BA
MSDYFKKSMIEIVKKENIYEYRLKGNVPLSKYPMIMNIIDSWLLDYRFRDKRDAEKELQSFVMCLKQYSLDNYQMKRYCVNQGISLAENVDKEQKRLLELGIEYIKEINLWILPSRIPKKESYELGP